MREMLGASPDFHKYLQDRWRLTWTNHPRTVLRAYYHPAVLQKDWLIVTQVFMDNNEENRGRSSIEVWNLERTTFGGDQVHPDDVGIDHLAEYIRNWNKIQKAINE